MINIDTFVISLIACAVSLYFAIKELRTPNKKLEHRAAGTTLAVIFIANAMHEFYYFYYGYLARYQDVIIPVSEQSEYVVLTRLRLALNILLIIYCLYQTYKFFTNDKSTLK